MIKYDHLRMNTDSITALEQALLRMDRIEVETLVERILETESNISLVDSYLAPAMEEIGSKWEAGETSLAQVYMAGRMCESIADRLAADVPAPENGGIPLAVTVLDDYHVLGKRLIASFLKGAGYPVIDFGRTGVEELVEKTVREQPKLLLISVLMLPSALEVKSAAEQIRKKLKSPPKIIVGGAPFRFDPTLWKEVGADAVGKNAGDAIRLVSAYKNGELS